MLWSCGSRGDVEPLVALAARLRALGAQALMCAPRDSAERLAELDVPLMPIERLPRDRANPATAGVHTQFDQAAAAAQDCDVVVASGLLSGAAAVRSVAERLGIPYFYVVWSPIHLPTALDPAQRQQFNEGADGLFGGVINDRRAALGLPPVRNVFDYALTDRPWMAADPVLAPLRPGVEAVQTGAWILPDERPLPADLAAFLAAGPPPVYVGFGSSGGAEDAARVAVEAARAQGCRVILSRGWYDLALPDDATDCFAVGEVNLQALFGRVAVAVHHDGTGTTHVASQAGAPQILVRQIVGQVYYSERLVELGAGAAVDGPAPTFDALSAALRTALAPRTRERAAAVAGRMRTDGAAVAARMLLDAVSREKPPVSV
ncbi:glycosyltransferase [Micromonospora zhanjiangensis]|uniref:Glycosyltransferase n=1 Tax=Micromonospora zhanjiangensis TaxID=1522057 RepID=A0ABV8KQJ5_9ACTN